MRRKLIVSFVVVLAGWAGVSQANAQEIATVDAVRTDLNEACNYSGAGVLANLTECLAAVDRAIVTVGAYSGVPQVPPQVDIGYLLCALLLERPSLATLIIDKIDLSGNGNLALGCSNALGSTWVGPRPIISPA